MRASDLPKYLKTHQAAPEMRRVRFDLSDRLVLIPVEVVHVFLPLLLTAVVLRFLGGWSAVAAAVAAVLAGVVLFPILLPWLPTRDFSSKGFFLGGAVTSPFALSTLLGSGSPAWWRLLVALALLLALPPVTAFLALIFTGSTPFTSRSGVRREIFRYIRPMAGLFAIGVALFLILSIVEKLGGLR